MLWSQPYSPTRPVHARGRGSGQCRGRARERAVADPERLALRNDGEPVLEHVVHDEPGPLRACAEPQPLRGVASRQVQLSRPLVELRPRVPRNVAAGERPRPGGLDGGRRLRLRQRPTLPAREQQAEGLPGDAIGHGVGAVLGGHDHDPELVVRKGEERRREAVDRPAVAHETPPLEGRDTEAQPEGGLALRGKRGRPHPLERLRLQDGAPRAPAAREEDGQEAPEVAHGRVEAARGRHPHLEPGNGEDARVVGPHECFRHAGSESRLGREGARAEPQGLEDGALHVPREPLALAMLQHPPHHRDARVRVLRPLPGRVDEGRAVQAAHGLRERRRPGIEVVPDRGLAHEPRAVGHQHLQGDRAAEGVLRPEVAEVARHRDVEVEDALLHELHDRDVRDELGDRAHAVDVAGRELRRPVLVRPAERRRPDDLLVLHEGDGEAGDPLVLALVLGEALERGRQRRVGARRGLGLRDGGDEPDEHDRNDHPSRHPSILSRVD